MNRTHTTMPNGPLNATLSAMRADCDIHDNQIDIKNMKHKPYKIQIQPHYVSKQPMYVPVISR